MVMCIFANVEPQMQVDLINAACGYHWTIGEMMQVGERGWNMKRAVNNRLGLTAANDRLPKALLEPLSEGGTDGYVPDIQTMLRAYYDARGWDPKTGYPTKEKLSELGLEDVVQDLWNNPEEA